MNLFIIGFILDINPVIKIDYEQYGQTSVWNIEYNDSNDYRLNLTGGKNILNKLFYKTYLLLTVLIVFI